MTNFVYTTQIQGTCDEEYGKQNATCQNDGDCQRLGPFISGWNGLLKKMLKIFKIF